MRRRGFTLIELMVAVAILGILAVTLGGEIGREREQGGRMVQRERALQVLEYQASAILAGRTPDAEVSRKLLELLPGGRLEVRHSGGVSTMVVSWEVGRGRESRQLELWGGGR